ncbi:unnamed protein product [Penicillium salamii]|uniref:Oleate hydratase n=1 Tax=Penicillium salamii TaxID=1612424 RepID=A0A9W4NZP8_9EURO|nr:unnamed protein product [Penicillium salamii]CAG8312539.1 unnamed protein product [Penicillium salamii]CAG8328267.1 unnamed protein product [Penicillium salamii]CAG8425405.1 unnamed protein product [Penicillium salamii]CAG8429217.1 unnamed protein product [Penicillium salamii]
MFDMCTLYQAVFHHIRIRFAPQTHSMDSSSQYNRRSPETTQAWILGSGTASLASAVYLIKNAHLRPSAVHILDEHLSLLQALHHQGSTHAGYDQFAGCLPVPVGSGLTELLDVIPSAVTEGRSYLHDLRAAEEQIAVNSEGGTCFIAQNKGAYKHLPTKSLNIGWSHRIHLMRLLLKGEKSLEKKEIRNFFRESFFRSTFWTVWSTQQYLTDFHSLGILSCLDLTGYYQYESIHLPIYFFLRSQGVDFQFDVKIRNIETTVNQNRRTISRLAVSQNGLEFKNVIGPSDIVIATPGSTVSGTAIGTNDHPPACRSIEAGDHLDANWALWLEAGNKYSDHGNPYTFCTRKSESMLESFTITTEHIGFVEYIQSLSRCTSQAGAIILMMNSNWGLRLCLPVQPVFTHQSQDVCVLWGFALFPENEGEHVKKNMLLCSGAEIMSEILYYLNTPGEMATEALQRSITIPRVMPRMSSALLTRSLEDRACITPDSIDNLGLVGPFVETPWRTCVDTSYGVHVAQAAVSHLMGLEDWPEEPSAPSILRLLVTLLWK